MTTPVVAEPVLSTELRAKIAGLIGDVKTLPPEQAVSLAEAARDRRTHDHPRPGEDLYCLNLTSWLGERVPYLLRLLLDVAAENENLRSRAEVRPGVPREPHRFVRLPDTVRASFCKSCGDHVLDPVHDA